MPETSESYYARHAEKYDKSIERAVPELIRVYGELGSRLPANTTKLLNLGGGTGTELISVFKRFPNLYVDVYDLSPDMVAQLVKKFPDKDIRVVCQSYFAVEFKYNFYDVCVAINSLNTVLYDDKIELYYRVKESLKDDGMFLLFDKFAESEEESDKYSKAYFDAIEYEEIVRGKTYNFYLPLTLETEKALLEEAGFRVDVLWSENNFYFLKCHVVD